MIWAMRRSGGLKLAFIDYRRNARTVTMTHAEVLSALQGRRLGSALVRGALELVRARGEKVVPLCSFVALYITRRPEVQHLLDGSDKPLPDPRPDAG